MSEYDNHSSHSLNPNYMNDDNYSIVTDTTMEESVQPVQPATKKNKRRTNKLYDEIKAMDPGYHKIVRRENGVKLKTEVYSTSFIPGTMIRDAITGHKYNRYRVGSSDESLFFKAKDVSGTTNNQPNILFYESPEQFERHMKVNISTDIKKSWTDNFAKAKAMVNAE